LFFHRAKKKFVAIGDQWKRGAHKIGGVDGGNLLRLAAVNAVESFRETRFAGAQPGDGRIATLDERNQGRLGSLVFGGRFSRITGLDQRVRGVLATFRWIQLFEARAKQTRLPVFTARGDLLLFNAIFHFPDLGPVTGSEANDDDFKERVVGSKIQFVVELADEGAKFF
jgi:hypothetical protein